MKSKIIKFPPGDFGIWIVIYIELLTFGVFFIAYAFSRSLDIEMFNSSQLLLDKKLGVINTIALITSSYLVVQAVDIVKTINTKDMIDKASNFLLGAMAMGGVFMILKIIEFSDKYDQGINLSTNKFFMFYFILTVFHFLHVLFGVIILYNLYKNTKNNLYNTKNHLGLETGASYWHMVDLLWIVLFPLIYIMR